MHADDLARYGWRVDVRRGQATGAAVSVAFCLYIDNRQHVCVPGYGPTPEHALADAARQAVAWMRRQPHTHPLFSRYPEARYL